VTSAPVSFLAIGQKLIGKSKDKTTWTDSVVLRTLILLDITLQTTVRIISVPKMKLHYAWRADFTFTCL